MLLPPPHTYLPRPPPSPPLPLQRKWLKLLFTFEHERALSVHDLLAQQFPDSYPNGAPHPDRPPPLRWKLDRWEGPQLRVSHSSSAGQGRLRLKMKRNFSPVRLTRPSALPPSLLSLPTVSSTTHPPIPSSALPPYTDPPTHLRTHDPTTHPHTHPPPLPPSQDDHRLASPEVDPDGSASCETSTLDCSSAVRAGSPSNDGALSEEQVDEGRAGGGVRGLLGWERMRGGWQSLDLPLRLSGSVVTNPSPPSPLHHTLPPAPPLPLYPLPSSSSNAHTRLSLSHIPHPPPPSSPSPAPLSPDFTNHLRTAACGGGCGVE